MTGFIGEYHCKIDSKGRLLLPSELRKQLSPENQEQFVISRGVDECLSLYTVSEWGIVMNKLRSLNRFKIKDRKFARMFRLACIRLFAAITVISSRLRVCVNDNRIASSSSIKITCLIMITFYH